MSSSRLIQRHPDLDAALKRLAGALDLLEAAAVRHDRAEGERRDLGDVLAAVEEDRGRLADELDIARKARASLAEAAEEVAGRLNSTGAALRGLIEAQDTRGAQDAPQDAQQDARQDAPREPPPGASGAQVSRTAAGESAEGGSRT